MKEINVIKDPKKPPPVKLWQCPNCGQVHFGDDPPDMCEFCRDFTTWRPIYQLNSSETDEKSDKR